VPPSKAARNREKPQELLLAVMFALVRTIYSNLLALVHAYHRGEAAKRRYQDNIASDFSIAGSRAAFIRGGNSICRVIRLSDRSVL